MSMDKTDQITWYEAEARARKVTALADWVVASMRKMRGVSTFEALHAAVLFCDRATADTWALAAEEAGVHPPSEITVAAIKVELQTRLGALTALPADPFAGLPG